MMLVPTKLCHAVNTQSPHYIHEDCLELLQCDGLNNCPRCKDLELRTCVESKVSRPIYCKSVQLAPGVCGFKATAKLQKVCDWIKTLPETDKAVIYSFFEGSLDLIEGILVEDLGIVCARLDNDCSPHDQALDLKRFKSSSDCKILLATVQSCGSGLNIEEANHVAFLDRWFDASIHEQAIDRCYNLNQKKKVKVTYFDAAITVDEVRVYCYIFTECNAFFYIVSPCLIDNFPNDQIMKAINDAMSTNASISLADGTKLGAQQRSIRYQDVSGPIYRMIKAIVSYHL